MQQDNILFLHNLLFTDYSVSRSSTVEGLITHGVYLIKLG